MLNKVDIAITSAVDPRIVSAPPSPHAAPAQAYGNETIFKQNYLITTINLFLLQ